MKKAPKKSSAAGPTLSVQALKSLLAPLREMAAYVNTPEAMKISTDLDVLGAFLFKVASIAQMDVEGWDVSQRLVLKGQEIAQRGQLVANALRKTELELQKHKDQVERAAKIVQAPELSHDEKEARVKQILGIE